jgi:hypothetical protein
MVTHCELLCQKIVAGSILETSADEKVDDSLSCPSIMGSANFLVDIVIFIFFSDIVTPLFK